MMRNLFKDLRKDERGVSALEYAILAGILIVVVAAGVGIFKDDVKTLFSNASTAISDAKDKSTTTTTP